MKFGKNSIHVESTCKVEKGKTWEDASATNMGVLGKFSLEKNLGESDFSLAKWTVSTIDEPCIVYTKSIS